MYVSMLGADVLCGRVKVFVFSVDANETVS